MDDPEKNTARMRVLTLLQETILSRVKRLAPSKLSLFLRAYEGTANKRGAIKAKCLGCSDLVVAEVRHCTATGCPLWRYRPCQLTEEDV